MNSFESDTGNPDKANTAGTGARQNRHELREEASTLPGDIDAVVTQQSVDNADKFSGSEDECAFAFGLWGFLILSGVEPI